MKALILLVSMLFLSGCLGMTGTKITASVPNGPAFSYTTDESKQIDGLKITKAADGWEVSLNKSSSKANETMAKAMLEMVNVMKSVAFPLPGP